MSFIIQLNTELLERTESRGWLGEAYYYLGLNCNTTGDFELALDAAAQADTIAKAIGDRRLETNGRVLAGWSYAYRGEWEAAIEACQRALDRAPDPFETAIISGSLGFVYLRKETLPRPSRYGSRQFTKPAGHI